MNQEMVARSLGASRARAFLMVTLPQIRFAVIVAARCWRSSRPSTRWSSRCSCPAAANSTLTRNMFLALRDQIDPTIAAISTMMIVVTSVLFGLSQLIGKGEDRSGAGR